ncbi:restriction endonuclease, partial [Nocardia farcinica]|uniref:restriction endonuclease n=1 Tax=Nocardia farcinica TaxID=37329 RepID=UPI001E60DFA3
MGSVHEVIEAFRLAPSNSERGTKFEQLMVRYFELDPMLAQQYDKVWRWTDWPDRAGKPDTGIDLVARERDTGALTAIQCKFYEPTHVLAKGDIDSFFTASGKKPFTSNDQNLWIPGGRAFPEDDRRSHRILIKTSVGALAGRHARAH